MADEGSLRVHGDPDRAELARLGIEPRDILDFSVNVSPFGPHPDVVRAAREAALDRYPDATGREAREALAHALDVSPCHLVLGHGAADLIWTIARRFCGRGTALLAGPTFSEARAAIEAHGGTVVEVRAREEDAFRFDPATLDIALRDVAPRLAYLCHPNNPTGTSLAASEIRELALRHASTTFLVDQAFLSLSSRHAESRERMPDNAILVRSLTKDHALPGLRIAYALAPEATTRAIEAARPPWTTSAPAQAAIAVAARHPEHVAIAREHLLADRALLVVALEPLGLSVVPSDALFSLVRVGDADSLRARLLAHHGVLVRSGTSFGLPHHVRLCARPAIDVERLVAALRAELSK